MLSSCSLSSSLLAALFCGYVSTVSPLDIGLALDGSQPLGDWLLQ